MTKIVKSSIGIKRTITPKTTAEKNKLSKEAIGISTDATQMARAIINGEWGRAKKQHKQLIARLNRLRI